MKNQQLRLDLSSKQPIKQAETTTVGIMQVVHVPIIDDSNTFLQTRKRGHYNAIHFQEQRYWREFKYKRDLLTELSQESSLVEQLKQLNPSNLNSQRTNYQIVEQAYNTIMFTTLYHLAKTSEQKQHILAWMLSEPLNRKD